MNFRIELDREEDGRTIAEVIDLPGVLVYGKTEPEAIAKVQALALRVIADRVEYGEEFIGVGLSDISFEGGAAT